jgi:lysophospholipase L1-like esterase
VTRPPLVAGAKYLALGDSVTFGYVESNVVPPPDYRDARSFIAYPQMVGQALRLRVTNAACPGETTASLINAHAQSNGCENSYRSSAGYRRSFPLHVRYNGSQLAFAVSYLRRHRNVRLVSLMIGANDLFLCQKMTSDACLATSEQQAAISKIARNVRVILSTLRRQAHYRGQLLLLNYYSPFAIPLIKTVIRRMNAAEDAVGRRFGVEVADGYGEFERADRIFGGDPCKAGLVNLLSTGSCGVHPTYAGQNLLSRAVLRTARSTG